MGVAYMCTQDTCPDTCQDNCTCLVLLGWVITMNDLSFAHPLFCSLMNKLTMDVIAATAFGVDAEAQTNPDSQFLRHGMTIVRGIEGGNPILTFFLLFLTCESSLISFTSLYSSVRI